MGWFIRWLIDSWQFARGEHKAMNARNTPCSFCQKSYGEVGPLVEGPNHVYICGGCIELCQSILEQTKVRRGSNELTAM